MQFLISLAGKVSGPVTEAMYSFDANTWTTTYIFEKVSFSRPIYIYIEAVL